ncbi:MAG: phosphoribosylamine--glycine ligase [Candidatus Bilamarchaeaceae archaeon]
MTKILIVGNGAREHAIAECIARDAELYSVMPKKNPAIARLSKKYWLADIHSPEAVSKALAGESFDICFSSPDATLAAGISDVLSNFGEVASPSKNAARIEWDKGFARMLLEKYKIPGSPRLFFAKNLDEAKKAMDELGEIAVKPLGLTGGKGVKISGEHFSTYAEIAPYIKELIAKDGVVLIEEKLIGEEFTLQAFSDGKNLSFMPPVQDHKRAFENDIGPNTGGMGSYSTGDILPFLENKDIEEAKDIMQKTIIALRDEGAEFKGVLYGQFMATADGVKVIEFNSRFGDPEAMNVLALLRDSLSNVFGSIVDGSLGKINFDKKCTVVKYLVPEGYPDNPKKDAEVKIDEKAIEREGAKVYYASVYEKDGRIYTTSSRAFGILGISQKMEEAEQIAEKACTFVSGPVWHRKDIGTKSLIQKRIDRMNKIRRKN